MAPCILPAGLEAAADLALVHAAAFAHPWDADALAEAMASPCAFALQAGTPPMGFILARGVAGEAEILTLAVAPAARRQGLGRALVDAAAALAAEASAEVMWLEVAEDNTAARALYAAAGFEPCGRRTRYYSRPQGAVDALMLRRRLNTTPA